MTLGDLLSGTEPDGFWVCDKYYGEDGTRLPSNVDVTGPCLHGSGGQQGSAAPEPSSGD